MKKIIKAVSPVLAVFLMLILTFNASADWYSDVSEGTKVRLTGEDRVTVDSYAGVDSYYSAKTPEYTSAELVVRFYSSAFSLNISTGANGPVMLTQGYVFQTPSTPGQGDIIYSASTGRWAVVKSATSKKLTMFEQDTASDGYAYKGRTVPFPSDSYAVFTPRSTPGHSYPVLKNAKTGQTIRTASGGRTSDTTTAGDTATAATSLTGTTDPNSTTGNPSNDTTSGYVTTGPEDATTTVTVSFDGYTTYRSNEAEVIDNAPTYTTQSMPEGYEQFLTSAQDGESVPTSVVNPAEAYTEYYEEQTERTENFETTGPAKEDKSIDPTLIFGLAMVGGIVCITGAGILAGVAIKKRNEEDD